MLPHGNIAEVSKILRGADPKNYTGAAMTAKYVSMKGYNKLGIYIVTGAWAAGTAAVSLLQATNVAAAGAKALGISWMWTDVAADGVLVRTAVVANTFNLDTASKLYVLEVDGTDLDAGNGFDCVSLVVATPGANADLYAVIYHLLTPRYAQSTPPSALLD